MTRSTTRPAAVADLLNRLFPFDSATELIASYHVADGAVVRVGRTKFLELALVPSKTT